MGETSHIILTRFNVRVDAAWATAAQDTEWLEHRFGLFEQFCLPSILSQSVRDFDWAIFFDSDTPDPYRARAEALSEHDRVHPIFIDRFDPAVWKPPLWRFVDGSRRLITTRLDNDDALARTYVERAQQALKNETLAFVNFNIGCTWRQGRLYRATHRSNAFVSMVEPTPDRVEEIQTAWAVQHMEIRQFAPVIGLGDPPGWLQVIHGANVLNRVRGRRLRAGAALEHFEIDPSVVPERESAAPFLYDVLLKTPVRAGRDLVYDLGRAARRRLRPGGASRRATQA